MLLLFFAALAGLITTSPATLVSLIQPTANIIVRDVDPLHDVVRTPAVLALTKPPAQELVTRTLSSSVSTETIVPKAIVKARVSTGTAAVKENVVPSVPFFSQFSDIKSPKWQKVGCGITDLTMLIHYYRPGTAVTVDQMLAKGIAAGAYDNNAGWIYQGLFDLAAPYGLHGTWYDLSKLSTSAAFARFKNLLADGPVILSVHYKFDPKSSIPHLVVINGIRGNTIFYNDPATTVGTKQISVEDFLNGWKRRVLVIRPISTAFAK